MTTLQICEHVFADDVGILIPTSKTNFQEVENYISLCERALDANLNLCKSFILPIGFITIPTWIQGKYCTISKQGDISRYSGAPIHNQVSTTTLIDYCLNNVGKHISFRKDKHLSFVQRILSIKKILFAIPIYHMMYMYFSKSTAFKLQQLCKDLIWGFAKSDHQEIPIIA